MLKRGINCKMLLVQLLQLVTAKDFAPDVQDETYIYQPHNNKK